MASSLLAALALLESLEVSLSLVLLLLEVLVPSVASVPFPFWA